MVVGNFMFFPISVVNVVNVVNVERLLQITVVANGQVISRH